MSISEAVTKSTVPLAADAILNEVHLVGVCGSGMKPLAHALLSLGVRVSGSDPSAEKGTDLTDKGARLFAEHAGGNLESPDVVVYSSAIPMDNPELVEARRRGIPLVHRSEMLGWFLARKESVLVAGTHGKTTTTAMMTILLDAGRCDPWGFVGGEVPCYHGNLRVGGGKLAVAEADESDGTFLNLPRDHAIITNIEAEHLNYWIDEERLFAGFESFVDGMSAGGNLVLCLDDPGTRRLAGQLQRPFLGYSLIDGDAPYRAAVRDLTGEGSRFDLFIDRARAVRLQLSIPGRQNVANATAAFAMAHRLGVDLDEIAHALETFRGVKRRFTRRTAESGFLIIDDYGHHPTEIAATMAAARLLADERGGALHVVFQPHRYTRTQSFFHLFGRALNGADTIIVTDIYAAGEPPIEGISGDTLRVRIEQELGIPVQLGLDFESIVKIVTQHIKDTDIVLLLGAGTVTKLGDLLGSC